MKNLFSLIGLICRVLLLCLGVWFTADGSHELREMPRTVKLSLGGMLLAGYVATGCSRRQRTDVAHRTVSSPRWKNQDRGR